MSKMFSSLPTALALSVAVPASAALYNVDFVQAANSVSYTGAGVLGTDGQYWNSSVAGNGWSWNSMSAVSGLKDSTGASSGLNFDLMWNVGGALSYAGDHNGQTIYSEFQPGGSSASWAPLFDRSVINGPIAFVVSGLTAGQVVDVVLYQAYAVTNSPTYSINGISRTFTYAAATSSMVEGRDYHVVSGVAADSAGRIVILPTAGVDSNSGISAIQVDTLPAPGALALLGVAGLAGGRRRR